jgi:hypothetical protein
MDKAREFHMATTEEVTFADQARRAFQFLDERGFVAETLGPRAVRYGSSRVWIKIDYEPRDGGVNVGFGRNNRHESWCFLTFLSTVNRPLARQLAALIVEREEDAPAAAVALARALVQDGTPIIIGEDAVFDRMATTLAPMPGE